MVSRCNLLTDETWIPLTLTSHTMRVTEVSMEQRRNERVGETGYPRENQPTNDIVQHDPHMRKSGLPWPHRREDCTPVQCFARRGDESVDAHVSVAPSALTLLCLIRAKFLQPGDPLNSALIPPWRLKIKMETAQHTAEEAVWLDRDSSREVISDTSVPNIDDRWSRRSSPALAQPYCGRVLTTQKIRQEKSGRHDELLRTLLLFHNCAKICLLRTPSEIMLSISRANFAFSFLANSLKCKQMIVLILHVNKHLFFFFSVVGYLRPRRLRIVAECCFILIDCRLSQRIAVLWNQHEGTACSKHDVGMKGWGKREIPEKTRQTNGTVLYDSHVYRPSCYRHQLKGWVLFRFQGACGFFEQHKGGQQLSNHVNNVTFMFVSSIHITRNLKYIVYLRMTVRNRYHLPATRHLVRAARPCRCNELHTITSRRRPAPFLVFGPWSVTTVMFCNTSAAIPTDCTLGIISAPQRLAMPPTLLRWDNTFAMETCTEVASTLLRSCGSSIKLSPSTNVNGGRSVPHFMTYLSVMLHFTETSSYTNRHFACCILFTAKSSRLLTETTGGRVYITFKVNFSRYKPLSLLMAVTLRLLRYDRLWRDKKLPLDNCYDITHCFRSLNIAADPPPFPTVALTTPFLPCGCGFLILKPYTVPESHWLCLCTDTCHLAQFMISLADIRLLTRVPALQDTGHFSLDGDGRWQVSSLRSQRGQQVMLRGGGENCDMKREAGCEVSRSRHQEVVNTGDVTLLTAPTHTHTYWRSDLRDHTQAQTAISLSAKQRSGQTSAGVIDDSAVTVDKEETSCIQSGHRGKKAGKIYMREKLKSNYVLRQSLSVFLSQVTVTVQILSIPYMQSDWTQVRRLCWMKSDWTQVRHLCWMQSDWTQVRRLCWVSATLLMRCKECVHISKVTSYVFRQLMNSA
ncbi:hypothetical protein PR048_022647 [Dryococelus australis]|uniref:Uncharacterized protein n=1 Tax=Dryococelus australis TaxID=614101 RepID=A0ABQ9H1M3_9NEOP|nr:hypothetical protein PR048_022647 [Dryococelus australis]